MRFSPYSYHNQYRQSVMHLRSVPSYCQRICHLPTSQETYSRQRPTYQLPADLQPVYHIQINRTRCKIPIYWSFVSNGLLNPHQSAYCKHHSTETALLYIHHHLINAIGSQKLSCLCLLDRSATFDTTDHNILITRLSFWFGIHGFVLNWFKDDTYIHIRNL